MNAHHLHVANKTVELSSCQTVELSDQQSDSDEQDCSSFKHNVGYGKLNIIIFLEVLQFTYPSQHDSYDEQNPCNHPKKETAEAGLFPPWLDRAKKAVMGGGPLLSTDRDVAHSEHGHSQVTMVTKAPQNITSLQSRKAKF